MHLHNSYLSEFNQKTHLPRVVERRVDAAGGCEDDAVVGSNERGLARRGAARACVSDMRFIARMCVGNGHVRNDTFEPINSCGSTCLRCSRSASMHDQNSVARKGREGEGEGEGTPPPQRESEREIENLREKGREGENLREQERERERERDRERVTGRHYG